MSLVPTTTWNLQSSDLVVWGPSITTAGILSFDTSGSTFSGDIPAFPGTPFYWLPTMSTVGELSMENQGVASTAATLRDSNSLTWVFSVDTNNILTLTSQASGRWSHQPKALLVQGA